MSRIASRLLTVISSIPVFAVFVVISAAVIFSVLIVPIPWVILSVAFLSAIIESSIRTFSLVAFSSSVIGAIVFSIIWSVVSSIPITSVVISARVVVTVFSLISA